MASEANLQIHVEGAVLDCPPPDRRSKYWAWWFKQYLAQSFIDLSAEEAEGVEHFISLVRKDAQEETILKAEKALMEMP